MHHLRSLSAIRRFRIAALLLFGNYLLAPGVVVVLLYSMLTSSRVGVMVGGSLMMTSLAGVVVQWMVASRTSCPLCMTAVLAPRACVRSRKARTFVGSHRLRVALGILFMNRFRCQYCNEPTVMEIRDRPGGDYMKKHLRQSRRCQ